MFCSLKLLIITTNLLNRVYQIELTTLFCLERLMITINSYISVMIYIV